MASTAPSFVEKKNEQQKQQLNKANTYENTKHIINESIKHFNEFTNSINEVCRNANLFASSLQSLEDVAMPEVIGSSMFLKVPKKKIFDSTEHLKETLDTFTQTLSIYSEKVKNETIEEFDNFILQVVCPSHDELKGVYEHNNNIIEEFRYGFYSLMNHFYAIGAELLENFLICGECNIPIGFTHQPTCNIKDETNYKWRRGKYDDKFITYSMKFSFDELLIPARRNKILKILNKTLSEQCQGRNNKNNPLTLKNTWPLRFVRSGSGSSKNKNKSRQQRNKHRHPVHAVHQPLFHPTVWTPSNGESVQMMQNYNVISFSYQDE